MRQTARFPDRREETELKRERDYLIKHVPLKQLKSLISGGSSEEINWPGGRAASNFIPILLGKPACRPRRIQFSSTVKCVSVPFPFRAVTRDPTRTDPARNTVRAGEGAARKRVIALPSGFYEKFPHVSLFGRTMPWIRHK